MPQSEYLVKARARNGRLVETKIRAASEAEALALVKQQGSMPIAVEQSNVGLNREIHLGGRRVKPKDLAIATRQMATMLSSGLPILRCLSILADQTESSALRDVLIDVRAEVERGESFSEALARHKEFPPLMVSMVRAGELGGFLDGAMLQIAETIESDVQLRARIKAALTYPIAVGVIAIIIVTAMLLFVVPVFAGMYESLGGELPLPTQILMTISNALNNPIVLVGGAVSIVVLVVLYRKFRDSPGLRNVIDPLKFRLPVFGPLFKKIALARFTRNFSTLLRAGVPILATLDIVGETSGNIVIARAVTDVKESVRQGSGMAKPLSQHDVFPEMVVQMVAVGEDTGALDAMLSKIADFYDQEAAATTEQLMALLEPVMIIALGLLVGAMVISLYLPIFKIYELIN